MANELLIAKDLESIINPAISSVYSTATAGGTGDNTEVVGATIDRLTLVRNTVALTGAVPIGGVFMIYYEAVLQATYTLTIKNALVEDSADGSTWATVFDQTGVAGPIPPAWPAAGVVDTGATGGSTQRGVMFFGTDLRKCRRYVRFDFTPDLSASGTDTLKTVGIAVLSGFDEVPPGVV
jgi:hypothetical protein